MLNQPLPVSKNDIYTILITGFGHSGEGVGRLEDFTVFVPYALPGETVSVIITEVKRTYAKARLQAVLSPSPDRVAPLCPVYQACGGCQLQHAAYQAQLTAKRQQVLNAVARIGKLDAVVHPVIGAESPWHYRNKMQAPVGLIGGKTVVGCFAPGTHTIIHTEQCAIQHESNNTVMRVVRSLLEELQIAPYNEQTGQGVVRHVIGRVGSVTGEVMIVLVTAVDGLPKQESIIARLRDNIGGLVSVIQNINSRKTNVIMGERTRTLWGQDTIMDCLGDLSFRISARSFFQVNTRQTAVLYDKVMEYAGLTGRETVVDAYCGTGTISLFLAKRAAKVYGIEIVPSAIDDAKRNAQNNAIYNTEFLAGDAIELMPRLYQDGVRPAVIVADPPRAGCEPKVLQTFAAMQPERMVYVSCNPASLARDLALLAGLGYVTREIQPVDMFPMTSHVECVALLTAINAS